MQLWAVKLQIHGENETVESNEIKYLPGMFQGDTLSVIMFILCFNPLSHLLNKCDGYMMGTLRCLINGGMFIYFLKISLPVKGTQS